MKWVTYLTQTADIQACLRAGVTEVILAPIELSRGGTLPLPALQTLAQEAKNAGLRPVLEWDILMTQDRMDHAQRLLKKLDLSVFAALRVQDPGAVYFCLHHLWLPLQLNLETGNHNLAGILRWKKLLGSRLDKIILSIELPAEKIREIIATVQVPTEIMGLGPILLFYTPRYLLSIERNDLSWLQDEETVSHHRLEATADSEESLHRGFRIRENSHGTFVYHSKDYCLVDRLNELRSMGLHSIRLDERLNPGPETILKLSQINSDESASAFIQNHPVKVTRCFFQTNATDILFKKLKNTHTQRVDQGFVGEVVEVSKSHYIVAQVLGKARSLKRDRSYRVVTPNGKEVLLQVHELKNLDAQKCEEVKENDFAMIPYAKSITVRSMIYEVSTAPSRC